MAETPGSMPAVRKAARLLKFLGRAPHPLGVTELSRLSGTHKSTVSRMLRAMELEGLVVQDPLTAKFSLGPELTFLGVYRFERGGLAAMARPYLERLQAATRETVSLDIFDGEKVVALDWIQSDLPVSYRSDPTRPGPIHCTAAGRVLLAYQPEETIERVLGRPLSPCAGRTRTDPEAVWAELERVRAQGFAMERNEWEEGLTALATPVWGPGARVVAALAVSGPTFRLNRKDRRERVLAQLQLDGAALSQRIGYRPPQGPPPLRAGPMPEPDPSELPENP